CMPTVISDERGPFGRNVPLAAAIRAAVRAAGHATPVVTSGGIFAFEQAEAILRRGEPDFVAAARQTLAEPDGFRKIRLGPVGRTRRQAPRGPRAASARSRLAPGAQRAALAAEHAFRPPAHAPRPARHDARASAARASAVRPSARLAPSRPLPRSVTTAERT